MNWRSVSVIATTTLPSALSPRMILTYRELVISSLFSDPAGVYLAHNSLEALESVITC